ncbi:MAG TPA: cysteine hydrolase family protein [Steroidobacteraceae bacterium]|jgi:nicotinamidase-related amidase|nr:cysteine hydrolase family protein [Steroidobacteraceae bacterium]
MIKKFDAITGLLLIDVQKGVDVLEHWGGPQGRRNNPQAEGNIRRLLDGWRSNELPVFYTMHDSREERSPLKLALPTGSIKEGLEPRSGDTIIKKDVNSGFIGTNLELMLQRRRIHRLVVAGFFTNMCVETTVRTAGNLGFDTYVVEDACATTNRVGWDGVDRDAELVHAMALTNMDGEFCTALKTPDVLRLLNGDAADLHRRQGNE